MQVSYSDSMRRRRENYSMADSNYWDFSFGHSGIFFIN